jgi:hypothetical protein
LYAYEYYENYPLYSISPGRASQAPLILRIISRHERVGAIDELLEVS